MTVTPVVEPESLGIDTERLEELRTRVRREVDGGVLRSCQFALTCGNMKYASTLPGLAMPVPSTGHGFLSPDLTSSPDPFGSWRTEARSGSATGCVWRTCQSRGPASRTSRCIRRARAFARHRAGDGRAADPLVVRRTRS